MKIRRIVIGAAVVGGVLGVSAAAMAAITTNTTPFKVTGKAASVQHATAKDHAVGGWWCQAGVVPVSSPGAPPTSRPTAR